MTPQRAGNCILGTLSFQNFWELFLVLIYKCFNLLVFQVKGLCCSQDLERVRDDGLNFLGNKLGSFTTNLPIEGTKLSKTAKPTTEEPEKNFERGRRLIRKNLSQK